MAGEYGRHSLYKMLGYFSLVGLLRLHSLLGDYYQAIKVLENIELNKKVRLHLKHRVRRVKHLSATDSDTTECVKSPIYFHSVLGLRLRFLAFFLFVHTSVSTLFPVFQSMYSRVPECQITTYYYVGFAYLMMRRYQDAIRVFANILLYIQRTRNMFQRSTYKYEMVSSSRKHNRHFLKF